MKICKKNILVMQEGADMQKTPREFAKTVIADAPSRIDSCAIGIGTLGNVSVSFKDLAAALSEESHVVQNGELHSCYVSTSLNESKRKVTEFLKQDEHTLFNT